MREYFDLTENNDFDGFKCLLFMKCYFEMDR